VRDEFAAADDAVKSLLDAAEAELRSELSTSANALQSAINTANGLIGTNAEDIDSLATRANSADTARNTMRGELETLVATREAAVRGDVNAAIATSSNGDRAYASGLVNGLGSDVAALEAQLAATEAELSRVRDAACALLDFTTKRESNGRCEPLPALNKKQYGMRDYRTSSTSWVTIPDRQVQSLKKGSASETIVRVTFTDSQGQRWHGTSSKGGAFRLLVDGTCWSNRCTKTTHADPYSGWNIFSNSWTWWIDNLSPGVHTFEIQAYAESGVTSEVLLGWENNAQENHLMVEELLLQDTTVAKHFPDARKGDSTLSDIPGRVAYHYKRSASTDLVIVHSDTIGIRQASHTTACEYQAILFGPSYPSGLNLGFHHSHSHKGTGWRIWPVDYQYFAQASSLSLGAGLYTVKIQFAKHAGASECLAGWPGSEANSIAIIERNPSLLSIAPNPVFSGSSRRQLGDIRLTTVNTWTNVAARTVSYTKKYSSSVIRVTLSDTLGFYTISQSYGCLWRLVVNGGTTRNMYSHGSSANGWRIGAQTLVWYPSVGTGTSTYQLQDYVPDGKISSCLNGWSSTHGHLLVEEIPQD